jgi:hypothetical protein
VQIIKQVLQQQAEVQGFRRSANSWLLRTFRYGTAHVPLTRRYPDVNIRNLEDHFWRRALAHSEEMTDRL